jgi:molybdopterin/thiamine biosynthesis adenylyltransferase
VSLGPRSVTPRTAAALPARPRLKPSLWYRDATRLAILTSTHRLITLDDEVGWLELLLTLLSDEPKTVDELVAEFRRRCPTAAATDVLAALAELIDLELISEAVPSRALSSEQRERFRNNLAFFEGYASATLGVDDYQQRLLDAHVVVLGVGAGGSTVLMNLVGLGVGRLTLVDFDDVELANFSRQFIYHADDLGRPKVECAAAWARAFDPSVQVAAVSRKLDGVEDVSDLITGADLVIGAVDDPPEHIRLWINEACVRAGVPFIHGGATGAAVIYSSIDPGRSACWACRDRTRRATIADQARAAGADPRVLERFVEGNPTVGPTMSLFGSLVAIEAMRFLTGFAAPIAAGVERVTNVVVGAEEVRSWSRWPECPVCAQAPVKQRAFEYPPPIPAAPALSDAPEPDDEAHQAAPALDGRTRLTLAELSVNPRGAEFMVGRPSHGGFVVVPPIAIAIIDAIRDGHELDRVGEIARQQAGQEVDVLDFAQTLLELGFVTHVNGVAIAAAPAQLTDGGRLGAWLARACRPLFSSFAWGVYALLFAACSAVMVSQPAYRPRPNALFFLRDPLVSVAILSVVTLLQRAAHEGAHWVAARVENVPARITISRRLYVLVLETDLTSVWALPRRRRFGPLLAGMAFDTVLLALLLLAQITAHAGWWHATALEARLLSALVLVPLSGIVFQFFVFLRTDLYAVLAVGLGCLNLTEVNALRWRRLLGRLSDEEASVLAEADPRDLQVARWYGWLFGAGMVLASLYFVAYVIPWVLDIIRWASPHIQLGPGDVGFWEALLFAIVAIAPTAIGAFAFARGLRHDQGRSPSGVALPDQARLQTMVERQLCVRGALAQGSPDHAAIPIVTEDTA